MSDVHRRAAASAPRLTSEEIATRGFAASFRGISEPEVRNFLKRVAEEIAGARVREDELTEQVDQLREQLKHPPIVTEDRLLDALGEETARVLRAAQESAEQIRTRSVEEATSIVAAADAAAAATREEADADAVAMRDAAQTAAAAREDQATTYAIGLRATVEAEVNGLRSATAAEVEAAREQSIAAAAAEVEASKEAGRELVNEARAVRERILADLGRRRLLLQTQIDELRAGRDRLLDAYRVVKRTLGDATEALVHVEARAEHELSGPPPSLDAPPVEGELAALAGELTGEAGAPSAEVEALFARLRAQAAPPGLSEAAAAPEPERSGGGSRGREPVSSPASVGGERTGKHPEPERSGGGSRGREPVSSPASVGGERTSRRAARASNQTDDEARAARDAVLAPLQRELGRKVKRALQDEQNDVLDRLRTVKGRPSATEVLPAPIEQTAALAAAMRAPVDAAFAGGRHAVGARGDSTSAPAAMVDGLAAAMVERLRARLVEAIDDSGDDDTVVTQRLGSRYREFKNQELDAVVGDTLAAAWALGIYDGVPKETTLRWVPSAEGRCPDCDDNALEPTVRSEMFPTGQPHPPAHPGCRCLLVPVW